jgi:hypothetical protein
MPGWRDLRAAMPRGWLCIMPSRPIRCPPVIFTWSAGRRVRHCLWRASWRCVRRRGSIRAHQLCRAGQARWRTGGRDRRRRDAQPANPRRGSRALAIGQRLGKDARALAIRVNPFRPQGLGHEDGRRGQAVRRRCRARARAGARVIASGAEWRGFHIFAGSQALDADAIIDTQAQCARACRASWPRRAAHALPQLQLGGGLGIPYFPGDSRSTCAVGAALAEPSKRCRRCWPIPLLHRTRPLSGGRGGVYLTRSIDRKVSHGEVFLVTDGGLHHQLGRVRQFRHRGAPQLSRDCIAVTAPSRSRKRSASSAACARRSIGWRTRPVCRAPMWAIWSRCSAPEPMAPAPARLSSWGMGRRWKCWFKR